MRGGRVESLGYYWKLNEWKPSETRKTKMKRNKILACEKCVREVSRGKWKQETWTQKFEKQSAGASRTEFAKLEALRSPKTWFLGDPLEDAWGRIGFRLHFSDINVKQVREWTQSRRGGSTGAFMLEPAKMGPGRKFENIPPAMLRGTTESRIRQTSRLRGTSDEQVRRLTSK